MDSHKSFHSAFTVKRSSGAKDLVLPAVSYVKNSGLLRRAPSETIFSAKYMDVRNSSSSKKPQKKAMDNTDVTSKEVRSTEWIVAEETADEKVALENVKLLDRWIYAKNIHKQKDTDFRKNLRAISMTKVSELGPDLFTAEFDSFIVNMVSQQLKTRKMIEAEQMRDLLKAKLSKCAKPSGFRSRSQASMSELETSAKSDGVSAIMKGAKEAKIDSELTMELQSLRLKKELYESKSELRELFAENDRLIKQIRDLKSEVTSWTNRKSLARRQSVAHDQSASSSYTARNNDHSAALRRGSMSLSNTQELHQRYVEEKKDREKRETQIAALNQQIEALRAQYDCNMTLVRKLDAQTEQIKPEIKALLQNQLDYYYDLLHKGQDARNFGLSWIIKTIWYLGGKIHMQRFPQILDSESIKYLMSIATKELERDQLAKKLRGIKVENRKLKLAEVQCVMQPSQRDDKTLEPHYSIKPGGIQRDDQEVGLEAQLFKLADQIRELRREEIERLTKQFLHNELRKKAMRNEMFNVSCALFGEDQGKKEFGKMMKKLQDILRNWEKCKSYAFVKPVKKKRRTKRQFDLEETCELDIVSPPAQQG